MRWVPGEPLIEMRKNLFPLRSDWVRGWPIWTWYCKYFPIRLVKTAELDVSKNYIFASHPHGILCSAAFGNFATEGTHFSEVFPGIIPHLLTLEGHYHFPLYREYLMSSGNLCGLYLPYSGVTGSDGMMDFFCYRSLLCLEEKFGLLAK